MTCKSPMAVAAVALNSHLLCFSKSRTPSSWLLHKTSLLSTRKKPHLSLTFCSSSSSSTSQSPEANTQTAESCVNLGLSLFSKGRVFHSLLPFFVFSVSFFFLFSYYYGIELYCLRVFLGLLILVTSRSNLFLFRCTFVVDSASCFRLKCLRQELEIDLLP